MSKFIITDDPTIDPWLEASPRENDTGLQIKADGALSVWEAKALAKYLNSWAGFVEASSSPSVNEISVNIDNSYKTEFQMKKAMLRVDRERRKL